MFRSVQRRAAPDAQQTEEEGLRHRLVILGRFVPDASVFLERVLSETRRSVMQVHDILDVLALAVNAWLASEHCGRVLPEGREEFGRYGLRMEMVVARAESAAAVAEAAASGVGGGRKARE